MNRRSLRASLPLLAGLVLLLPSPAPAQVRASERATVGQTVDGTVIELDYSRPRARGRTELFGGQVHWGEVWTPGANDATVLELTRDVEIEGHAVAAGRWSVWMVVAEEGPWEVVLDPRDDLFHLQRPGVEDDQVRFPVETRIEDPFVEVLTWSFPTVTNEGTIMQLAWGHRRVPLSVEVEPSASPTVAEEVAAEYVGQWWVTFPGSRAAGEDADEPRPSSFLVRHDAEGRLIAAAAFGPPDAEPQDILLLLQAEGIFGMGFMQDGELMEVLPDTYVEFDFEEGHAVGFTLRGPDDQVFATGRREDMTRVGAVATTTLLVAAAGAAGQESEVVLNGKTVEWLVASAALAAPAPLRDGAEVRGWTADGRVVTLRAGTNGIICLADRPGDDAFAAACYHDSLEPFMARGRELTREGVAGGERNETRWREIREGTLPMPVAAMVYNLRFADEDFDPATTDPATGGRLHAIYMRDATPESTGLPSVPGDGPWLMLPGTPSAHVMIGLPARPAPEGG